MVWALLIYCCCNSRFFILAFYNLEHFSNWECSTRFQKIHWMEFIWMFVRLDTFEHRCVISFNLHAATDNSKVNTHVTHMHGLPHFEIYFFFFSSHKKRSKTVSIRWNYLVFSIAPFSLIIFSLCVCVFSFFEKIISQLNQWCAIKIHVW